ncbi:MAG: hypothetical protein ABF620_06625 [Liquorilactobacillus satsumensis]
MVTHLNSPQKEAALIVERLQKYFKPYVQARYTILVVNNTYGHSYNFFFNVLRPQQLTRSIPLRRITTYHLEYLEELIKYIHSLTALTITFKKFGTARWPSNLKRITFN